MNTQRDVERLKVVLLFHVDRCVSVLAALAAYAAALLAVSPAVVRRDFARHSDGEEWRQRVAGNIFVVNTSMHQSRKVSAN